MGDPVTGYTFDSVAVITFTVCTTAGEDAARLAAQALESADTEVSLYDPDLSAVIPEGTTYALTCVSPRGKPAYPEAGEGLSEPLTGLDKPDIVMALEAFREARDGPSADEEHEAALELARLLEILVQEDDA